MQTDLCVENLLILQIDASILQANTKEMFEDDDLDISSGSDFDDDEDPDKIEVPGKWILHHFTSFQSEIPFFVCLFMKLLAWNCHAVNEYSTIVLGFIVSSKLLETIQSSKHFW